MKPICRNCGKEVHRWHEKYRGQVTVNRTGWWRKVPVLWGIKIFSDQSYWHLDCNKTANVPVINSAMKAFIAIMAFFLLTGSVFLITRQAAVVPIPNIGTFTLAWQDGAELYFGSAGVCIFFIWHAYEEAN